MNIGRGTAALALSAVLVLGSAGIAGAQPPAPYSLDPGISIEVSATEVSAGSQITVTVSGFKPFSNVEIGVESEYQVVAQFAVDANGSGSGAVTLPCLEVGPHTAFGVGTAPDDRPVYGQAAFTVTQACPTSGGGGGSGGGGEGIAVTGAQIGTVAGIGAILTATGIGIAYTSRRRRLADEE